MTAIWRACSRGNARVLERLGPDPATEDFDDLYLWARNGAVIDVLARHALPRNVGPVVAARIPRPVPSFVLFDRWSSLDPLRRLFELGMRWQTGTKDQIANVRYALLKTPERTFVEAMKLLTKSDHVSSEVLHELARTPAIKRRIRNAFMAHTGEDPWEWERRRPTRSLEVLKKCGIEEPKKPAERVRGRREPAAPSLPRSMEIGPRRAGAEKIQLDRAGLYELVWAEPVATVAERWGLSGPGLRKACQRLRVPVPPRGYWAKRRVGQRVRRPRLPTLPKGQVEEIVVWAGARR